jgi:hypothetical protein
MFAALIIAPLIRLSAQCWAGSSFTRCFDRYETELPRLGLRSVGWSPALVAGAWYALIVAPELFGLNALVSVLSVCPIAVVQQSINRANDTDEADGRYTILNRLGIAVGSVLWIMTIIGTYILFRKRTAGIP